MLAEAFATYIAMHGFVLPPMPFAPVTYNPATRSASNWRRQAAGNLDLPMHAALRFAAGATPERLPRCIRLNNYWCIKRAGWAGEVAADSEGHVAFSSAHEGAVVAVRLLRRYYLDYKRVSALAIVARWAPAQCGAATAYTVRRGRQRIRHNAHLRAIAPRGIHRTARARFLARHGRGGIAIRPQLAASGRTPAGARRAPSMQMMRTPSISPGLGERPLAIAPVSMAALPPPPRAGAPAERAVPRIGCTSEALRIRNYAAKMSAGAASDMNADLKLFEADGRPGPNLAKVLAQMAAVEIGPYKTVPKLIEDAIRAATEEFRQAANPAP